MSPTQSIISYCYKVKPKFYKDWDLYELPLELVDNETYVVLSDVYSGIDCEDGVLNHALKFNLYRNWYAFKSFSGMFKIMWKKFDIELHIGNMNNYNGTFLFEHPKIKDEEFVFNDITFIYLLLNMNSN